LVLLGSRRDQPVKPILRKLDQPVKQILCKLDQPVKQILRKLDQPVKPILCKLDQPVKPLLCKLKTRRLQRSRLQSEIREKTKIIFTNWGQCCDFAF
jgi:hypothetical protein